MAVAVKAAAFAMLLRVLTLSFRDPSWSSWAAGWPPVVATLAAVTITVANLIAGRQASVKQMLAYSSIPHAGYLLLGVAPMMPLPQEWGPSLLFFLLTYSVSTAAAF